jgi:membrane-associated protein
MCLNLPAFELGTLVLDIFSLLLDFVVHLDAHLSIFVQTYGAWVYALLFLIVFAETGLVVLPFLPGDSLLFVVGALCGLNLMNLPLVMVLLLAAAVLGNQTSYVIGRHIGPKALRWEDSRFFNKRAFDRTNAFYEKYGGVTIALSRFVPFVRTFAPFVAGVAEMNRARFTLYDLSGAVLWVCGLTLAGYLFGNIPLVKELLDKVILAIILIPALLLIWGACRSRPRMTTNA